MPTVAELRKRAAHVSLGTDSTGRLSPAAHYWTLYTGVPVGEHGLTYPFMWSPEAQRIRPAGWFPQPQTVWGRAVGSGGRCLVVDAYELEAPVAVDGVVSRWVAVPKPRDEPSGVVAGRSPQPARRAHRRAGLGRRGVRGSVAETARIARPPAPGGAASGGSSGPGPGRPRRLRRRLGHLERAPPRRSSALGPARQWWRHDAWRRCGWSWTKR